MKLSILNKHIYTLLLVVLFNVLIYINSNLTLNINNEENNISNKISNSLLLSNNKMLKEKLSNNIYRLLKKQRNYLTDSMYQSTYINKQYPQNIDISSDFSNNTRILLTDNKMHNNSNNNNQSNKDVLNQKNSIDINIDNNNNNNNYDDNYTLRKFFYYISNLSIFTGNWESDTPIPILNSTKGQIVANFKVLKYNDLFNTKIDYAKFVQFFMVIVDNDQSNNKFLFLHISDNSKNIKRSINNLNKDDSLSNNRDSISISVECEVLENELIETFDEYSKD